MTNQKQLDELLAFLVTERMHEYEDYLAGRIPTIKMTCGACKYVYSGDCKDCPFSVSSELQCETELRRHIIDSPTVGYTEFGGRYKAPTKRLVRARYKELLQLLEDNGWEYSYDD